MPSENIERAIKRARARRSDDVQEIMYEGSAPPARPNHRSGDVETERTVAEIRNVFTRAAARSARTLLAGNFGCAA